MAGVVQIAYSVADVEAAAPVYAERLGAGPFFYRHHPPMRATFGDGSAGHFVHSSAYGQWGDIQVELVAVHGEMATDRVHHMAVIVPSLDDHLHRMAGLGWPLVMLAETDSGMRFAFSDAAADLGHMIEGYEPAQGLLDLYARVRAASVAWDGVDPLRAMADLPRLS